MSLLVQAGPTLTLCAFLSRKKNLRSITSTKCLEIQTWCIFCETGADHDLIFAFWFEIVTSSPVTAREISPAKHSSLGLWFLKGANRSRVLRWKKREEATWLSFCRDVVSERESKSGKTDLKNQSRNVLRPIASSFPSLVDEGCLELLL